MARSSLVSLLRSWSAEFEREQRLELGERVDHGRRDVLAGLAAAAGVTALGLRPAVGLDATARIAIVGAGLAGLTAAYRLKQQGLSPVLYEGNTRIGGRCYTVRNIFANGQLAEHGGEFIDTDHHAIRNLAAELGLQLDDVLAAQPAGTREKYLFNGQPYDLADATKDYQALYPIVQQQNAAIGSFSYKSANRAAKTFDAMTARAWIAKYVPGGLGSSLGQLLDNAFAEENAADTSQQSALNIIYAIAPDAQTNFDLYYTGSDQRYHVHGGNDQITTILAGRLGGALLTSSNLTAIKRLSDGRIRLTIQREASTSDEVFDRVILALPFAVMRARVDYAAAGFRALKVRAIRELGMGASVKSQLQFDSRLWDQLGCNGEIRLRSDLFETSWDVTRAQAGATGIFNFWSGGSQAFADGQLDYQVLARKLLAGAEPILPGLGNLWNGLASFDVWKKNPWSLGSYSFYGPGYQTSIVGIEKEPEGNCFFAGEHTWSENGYLNAGVASGDRAAAQVIRSLSAS